MRKGRRSGGRPSPVRQRYSLQAVRWISTLAASPTKTNPTIIKVSSCLMRMAMMAMVPPSARLPVSPMNTLAG